MSQQDVAGCGFHAYDPHHAEVGGLIVVTTPVGDGTTTGTGYLSHEARVRADEWNQALEATPSFVFDPFIGATVITVGLGDPNPVLACNYSPYERYAVRSYCLRNADTGTFGNSNDRATTYSVALRSVGQSVGDSSGKGIQRVGGQRYICCIR